MNAWTFCDGEKFESDPRRIANIEKPEGPCCQSRTPDSIPCKDRDHFHRVTDHEHADKTNGVSVVRGSPEHMKRIRIFCHQLKEGDAKRDSQPSVTDPDEPFMASIHLNIVQIAHLFFKDSQGKDENPCKMGDEKNRKKVD